MSVAIKRTWAPTKKWIAAAVGSVASIAASWILTGNFDDVERGMVATAVVALAGSYFKSNDVTATGDGVPAEVTEVRDR